MTQKTIICLISTSRSGSTLVQHALSNHVDVAGLGELRRFPKLLEMKARCGCGQDLDDCPVWAASAAKAKDEPHTTNEIPKLKRRLKTFLDFVAVLVRTPFWTRKPDREESSFSVWNAREIAGEMSAGVLVDSSKDVEQFLQLARAGGFQLVPVHLVRDPRGVAWSAQRRTGYRPDEMAAHWLRFNLAASALRVLTRNYPWYFLRYEDFCADPLGHCRQILLRAGQSDPVMRTETHVDHSIGGTPGFKVEDLDSLMVDERWKSHLAKEDCERVWARTRLLARRLGYCG